VDRLFRTSIRAVSKDGSKPTYTFTRTGEQTDGSTCAFIGVHGMVAYEQAVRDGMDMDDWAPDPAPPN